MPARYKPLYQQSQSNQNRAKRECRQNDLNLAPRSSEQDGSDFESENRLLDSCTEAGDVQSDGEVFDRDDLDNYNSSNFDQWNNSDVDMPTAEGSSTDSDFDNNPINDCESDVIFEDVENDEIDENDNDDNNEYPEVDPVQQVLDEPLYDGAHITVAESLIATLNLSLRHNITGALLADILQLISLHCPPENKCKTTLYTFNKFFAEMQTPLIRHFYCTECNSSVEHQHAVCPECITETTISYFIEGPVIEQIRALFKRPGFADKLRHRVTRERHDPDSYEDIYDGDVYKELTQPGCLLANEVNISFTWYTDGVSIFKSSKFSIWAVYLIVNELPFNERTRTDNIVFAGLWFGEKKPEPNLFLEPLDSSLQELRQGIKVEVANADIPRIIKGLVICGTCDLPAKALFLNMKQFNGRFGCQKCKQEGEVLADRVRVYPYEQVILRTDEETRIHARQAHERGEAVCGVKGPTILSRMVHQNMRATAVDVMHCIFEGVVKALLSFWFSPAFSNHPASMSEAIDLVDKRLSSLSPPSFVQRLPRSLKKHLSYWKAHEFKSWFFYYSIPCVNDIMDETYFKHYLLLVLGISLLCKSSISPQELDIASRSLNEFVSMFENLYYRRYMSNNVHQILHLAENVRQFGPLWTTSCFPFEDLNGRLKSLVHGSNSAHLQIYSAVSKILILSTLKSEVLIPGTPAYLFCESLDYKRGRIKRHRVTESVYIVGKCKELFHLPEDIDNTLRRSDIRGNRYFQYQRLLKKKTMFTCTEYRRTKRTDSTFAIYAITGESDRIGRISYFVRITDCHCPGICYCEAQNYAILNPCVLENRFSTCIDNTELSNVHFLVDLECQNIAVDIRNLKSVCYYSKIEDTAEEFIIDPVNLLEAE